jgi:hypothetical protein
LRIFLSHSHKDNMWCNAFVDELKRYGADVWYDKQGLYVGAKWRQTIETELEERDIFLLVLTPNSWSSSWVQDELTLAMSHQKRIVSILHQPTEVKGFITTRQILKVVGLSSIEAAKSVASSLGLAPLEQRTHTGEELPTDEDYEYFEITVYRPYFAEYGYQIINTANGQVFHNLGYWKAFFGNPKEHYTGDQKRIDELKEVAKANGLEELPEKGEKWYSYRFRRKMQ